DGADQAHRAVLRAVQVAALRVGADHQADGPVGVHVVGPVLGVVLDHEDGGLRPVLALRHRLDQPAQGQVVAADTRLRRERARRRAGGVVLAQAHDDEARHGAVLLERAVLLEEGLHVVGVAHLAALLARHAVVGADVADQAGDAGLHADVALAVADALAVLAVTAVADPVAGAGVPQGAGPSPRQAAL